MSKKKKRRSNSAPSARTRSQGAVLADEQNQSRKRFDPTARNILFGDLVFLAVCQVLYSQGMMSDLLSGIATLVGLALLLIALWFQFGKKDIKNSGGPGGYNSSGWPGL